ncbi:MAG TPA: 4-alpha-glucanotransferase [Saprospiraceae bacterium]|nr:4-alpha-glucanotransferase [Saprospiraceae bacterium]
MYQRSSGILMHITSLPSKHGIGDLGKKAFDFVRFLDKSGQSFWQILPIGPTGYGDSPYQSLSTFAGNTLLIDLKQLQKEKLLRPKDFKNRDFGQDPEVVDFQKVRKEKTELLRIAFSRTKNSYKKELSIFAKANKSWLDDYSLFMALKHHHDLKSWQEWPKALRDRQPKALQKAKKKYADEILFWIFAQFIFFRQWNALKNFANEKGIQIIGDIPIYVAEDSADVWANPKLFLLDKTNKPICVSGCPPDAFSADGQLWGNPIYNWKRMEKQGFKWWINRIKASFTLFDVVRIDHFRGFEAYWSIPGDAETAAKGEWVKGPAIKLFDAVKKELGDLRVIAEDLGFLTQEVIDFKNETGFPGMKILEFAFDSKEESNYLPHTYDKNCIVYTGTHDNDTVMGWFEHTPEADVKKAKEYLRLTKKEGYNWGFIRGAWSSVAVVAIAQMQDFLGIDNRMNTPSTFGGNWEWRMKPRKLTKKLTVKTKKITRLYGR